MLLVTMPTVLAPPPVSRRPPALLVVGLVVSVLLGSIVFLGPAGPVGHVIGVSAGSGTSPPPGASVPTVAGPTGAQAVAPSSLGWTRLLGHGPAPIVRFGNSLTYDAADGYSVLFGGCGAHVCPLGDTWKLQDGVWTNLTTSLAAAPAPRTGASVVFDGHDGYLLLFGGKGSSGALSDTWKFSGGAWSPITLTGTTAPSPRSNASMVYDQADGLVLLFGGLSATGVVLGDSWTYSGGAWSQVQGPGMSAPAPRTDAALAYDASDGVVVLFGGRGAAGAPLDDTWSFVKGEWVNESSSVSGAPSARYGSTLATDPVRGGVILYGGENGSVLADTWEFVAHGWRNLGINLSLSPLARVSGGSTYDSGYQYVVLFGGVDGASYRSGLWLLLSPLAAQIVPTQSSVAPGTSDQFKSVVSGGLGPYNLTWSFGDGSASVVGPATGHTFTNPGTYVVQLLATDSLTDQAAVSLNITVASPTLTVSVRSVPENVIAGQTATVTAVVSGGTLPYTFAWSGPVADCSGAGSSILSCAMSSAGNYSFSVVVRDASGQLRSAAASVNVTGVQGGLSSPSGGSGLSPRSNVMTALTAGVLAIAIAFACGLAVITYRAWRRPPPRPADRPLCFAVPAWSETPPEFPRDGSDTAAPDSIDPWDRP